MNAVSRRPSPTIAPARRCAFAVVRRVFERGAYADLALHGEAAKLDRRDRALAMRLAYGAVQRKGTLDHLIERLAGRALARLDAPVLAALRLGLYELLYLDAAPDRAVVADAVELAKAGGGRGHGLVNAVLRRAAREGREQLLGSLDDATPERAAIMHSHPLWVARLLWDRLGADDARALMAYDNEQGEVALRVNTLVADAPTVAAGLRRASVALHADGSLSEALVLDGPFDAHGSPQWRSGALIAQSRAAMLVSRALDPQPGERVLDLCAAPGGKTTHLAALMGGEGEVVAIERSERRAQQLRETARRLRAESVRVEVVDAALASPERGTFDRVLVDPPCSGLGTLQARADLRWRATPEAAAQMVEVQRAILAAGAEAVRPGGVLVYSTCTISPAESEHLIANFLESHADFSLDDLAADRSKVGQPVVASALATASSTSAAPRRGGLGGTVLTLPHRDRTAGFFIARVRRS
ncbi:MAG TPA: 16S rRNA (cytosine(967)-C(5))-methyltransferase RsmB [Solirubrobacteraceae bacterium]|nr:16S rRNA (cytosine(967)-C(5))-methyltransferase RsmB [Solirubrobacteraceae bacterium]